MNTSEPCRELREALASEEFYNLMQAYRHTPVIDQKLVCRNFEAIEQFILTHAALSTTGETVLVDEVRECSDGLLYVRVPRNGTVRVRVTAAKEE